MLIVGGTGLLGRALAGVLLTAGLRPLHFARHDPAPGVLAPGACALRADRRELPVLMASGAVLADAQRPAGIVDVLAEGVDEVGPLVAALALRSGRYVAIGSAAVPRIAYPFGTGHGPLTPLGRARDLFARLDGDAPVDWVAPGEFAPIQPLWADDLARVIAVLLTRAERPRTLYHVAGPEVLDWGAYLHRLARGRALGTRLHLHTADALQSMNPAAWWIAHHLRAAPLLDDTLVRREVVACGTTLTQALPRWAAWCRSGAP